jgi:hypothetical protein
MKKLLTSGLVWLLLLCFTAQSFASTVTGQIQNAQGGAVANGVLTFQLTQGATISGTASLVSTSVSCYTDANGNIVGEPNPLVAPVLTPINGIGTLPAGTYFVKITYFDASGESAPSPEGVTAVTAGGNTITVSAPITQPASASGYNVYVSTTSGVYTTGKQGSVTGVPGSWGNFSLSVPLVSGAAIPGGNTSACKPHFNDEMQPSFVCYLVGFTNGTTGASINGFPQLWYLSGGSSGTVNVSLGTPQSNVCHGGGVVYPQAIVTTPPFNSVQSINGPLNLNGFGIAGPLPITGDTPITWTQSGTTTAGLVVGSQGATVGSSLFVNIPSLNTLFASGLGIDGTYSNPGGIGTAVSQITAYGVNSGGGYDSAIDFRTTLSGVISRWVRLNSLGQMEFYGATSGKVTVAAPATGGIFNELLPNASGTLALGRPQSQLFTGSGTFTIPAAVVGVKITLTAGGGGGGGGTAANVGSGGGAGSTCLKYLSGLTPGNTLTVAVGSGGGSNSGGAGINGVDTTVSSGTQVISTITAPHGLAGGGPVSTSSTGVAGGSACTNADVSINGGDGGSSTTPLGGYGGASAWGGGPHGANNGAGSAIAANAFGAGGAGSGNGGTTTGGTGANGVVLFEWVN